jgi:hypothetical protein
MRIVGWRSSLQALTLLLVAAILIFSEARVLAAFSWLHLYRNQFAFAPGDWFAWRLNASRRTPEKTCILIGASTVREGLSASAIEDLIPGTNVVNLATTGGHSAIDAIEIQARVLASLGGRYKCVVVGLHPMFLRRFGADSYDLVTTDYTAVMPLSGIFDLSRALSTFPNKAQLIFKYSTPLGQHSLVLRRLMRLWLYEAHRLYVQADTSRENYEEFEGEFTPQSQSVYSGPSVLKDIQESYTAQIKEIGWDRASSYGGKAEAAALRHSLQMLSEITDRVVVVEMPESYLFRHVDAVARKPYEEALASTDVDMKVLRCKIPTSDEFQDFHDAIHLSERGRNLVSQSVASFLQERDSTLTQSDTNAVCQIRDGSEDRHFSRK